jgi:hypothetical protein
MIVSVTPSYSPTCRGRSRRWRGNSKGSRSVSVGPLNDGGLGHTACRHHDHRNCCGGAGRSRRLPAGEAGRRPGQSGCEGLLRRGEGPTTTPGLTWRNLRHYSRTSMSGWFSLTHLAIRCLRLLMKSSTFSRYSTYSSVVFGVPDRLKLSNGRKNRTSS